MLENVVPGLRMTLKGVTELAGGDQRQPSRPSTATRSRPGSRPSSTPTTRSSTVTRSEITEKPIANADGPSSTLPSGALYGDTGLTSMLNALRRQMTHDRHRQPGSTTSADLGIGIPASAGGVVSEDAKAGKLTIDDTKLNAALDADWTSVKDFFSDFSK